MPVEMALFFSPVIFKNCQGIADIFMVCCFLAE